MSASMTAWLRKNLFRSVGDGVTTVVVGSALVNSIRDSLDGDGRPTSETVGAVLGLVEELAGGVRSVSRQAAE